MGKEAEELLSLAGTLKGDVLEPEDIAYAVLYLASEESKYVSGMDFVVNGGYIVLPILPFRMHSKEEIYGLGLKLLMKLYKQMIAEAITTMKYKNEPADQLLQSENGSRQKAEAQLQKVKPANQPQSDRVLAKPSESKKTIGLSCQECKVPKFLEKLCLLC
ncbi:hypothetical protein P3X46_016949 [Hevea brasiliensis]|uniref:Uncharacterized protein n=1 Tax=Hevea brasiliensis TaxID=3981 RepID=A0ABQ9M4K7_HEVBR|nr:uncharacterized protein LOC110665234 [Hevea brasiliensis]KAJ9173856.1 hypothetical protein P3X46_016949 [Hevea brasiliensis]